MSNATPSTACVCGRLRRAARALTQLYDDTMAPSGLRITQFSLLRTLGREGPMRITDLAGVALLDRTALSRNLEPLVAQGFVRIAPGKDARTREVSLTVAGKAALDRALPYWRDAQRVVARKMGQPHIDALVGLLDSVESLHPALGAPRTERPIHEHDRADWRTPTVVLVASALILSTSMGIRHGFGLFLQPMSSEMGWGRETFALAIAVQNLVWGVDAAVRGHDRRPLRLGARARCGRHSLRARPRHDVHRRRAR